MVAEIKTEGFKELDDALKKLPITMEKKILNKSLMGAMRSAVKDVKAKAPVHSGEQSESSQAYKPIRRNIKVSRGKSRKRWVKSAIMHTGSAFWALFYELGTKNQPARPFFLPAFKSAQTKILNEFRNRLKQSLEDEVKKVRKK